MTSLLDANDKAGGYPQSYYAASVAQPDACAALSGDIRADVCVIGAGFTGLSAALHLAGAGADVALIDAHLAGWGASGRNGGQLGSGQRVEQPELEKMVGRDNARAMWEIAEKAKSLVHDLCVDHAIACDLKPGIIHVNHRARYDCESLHLVEHMQRHYAYNLTYLAPDDCREIVRSPSYSAGVLDEGAGHLHPLKFALGLRKAALGAGVRLYENTRAVSVDADAGVVQTQTGAIQAEHIVLAGNGYLEGLAGEVERHVMPINNYIIATEPLSEAQVAGILSRDVAVADSKFVVNYFRLSDDRRLLFGGRESYGYRFPADIAGFVRKAMIGIFPQTREIGVDYGWGGTLAITMNRIPFLRKLASRVWNASGYSGHGVAMATMSGKLSADAIRGQTGGFDVMASVDVPPFPGGPKFRSPLLVAAMLWYSLRDRL